MSALAAVPHSVMPPPFHPQMSARIEGLLPTAPLRFLATEGMIADLWQVEGGAQARGSYISDHPRLVVFLDPVPALALSRSPEAAPAAQDAAGGGCWSPDTASLLFVPARQPLWSRLAAPAALRHLDLHFSPTAIGLEGMLPAAPVFLRDPALIEAARRLAMVIGTPAACPVLLDLLGRVLIQGLGRAGADAAPAAALSPGQLADLAGQVAEDPAAELPVEALARAVGLSEGWFAHAFRRSLGLSPHRWLRHQRVVAAQGMIRTAGAGGQTSLAGIALATGFADQAHFTRAFRAQTGTTPASWRRRLLRQTPALAAGDTEGFRAAAAGFDKTGRI